MVKTNYSSLNPVIVQALNNLQYRYSSKTPEMWCSYIRYPFKKLLEYNSKYFFKNVFIQMIERSYKDREFKAGRCSFHIYCTVCDFLVIIRENTIKCNNNHLKKCIAKTAKRHITYFNSIQKNAKFSYVYEYENRKRYVNHLIDSAKVIQRTWRAFKLRSETWMKRGWNMIRNDGTPDKKKYLGILSLVERKINSLTQEEYDLHTNEYADCIKKTYNKNITQKYIKEYLAKRVTEYKEYDYYHSRIWEGKLYPYNSLEINMFKSSYISTINGDSTIIDFSDINNNVEYVQ
ncbi:hypothetical protein C1645_830137 [Glomus cerebriforme]|uniref:Uncharacterized protein n=1 Tax=Glomus cerebriforme TaxID=658196 RepID=A0A397SSM0_9GLOM|nr:hypothetical protein C1645_830137 [Glomus cerebriforme]